MSEITVTELTRRLEAGENINVVDIREAREYDDWHIHGSTNLPVYGAIAAGNEPVVTAQLQTLSKERPIVAVCRVGQTSQVAAQLLGAMGYQAFTLAGGIRAWSSAWTEVEVPATNVRCTIRQVRRNGKGCLSYVILSDGRATVVDPCVDPSVYEDIARREGARIEHVLETHVHADHLSRARQLAGSTGARLGIPENERVHFAYQALGNDDTIEIGASRITVIATPGHTLESVCFLVDDRVLLSGDTLFLENIGRPDLEKGDEGAEAGAKLLYESLHDRVLKLDGNVLVCPGHTSDSIGFDGKPLSKPLGDITPHIDLLEVDKSSFVERVVGSLGAKPPNFERVLAVNEGREGLGHIDPLDIESGPNRCAVGKSL